MVPVFIVKSLTVRAIPIASENPIEKNWSSEKCECAKISVGITRKRVGRNLIHCFCFELVQYSRNWWDGKGL